MWFLHQGLNGALLRLALPMVVSYAGVRPKLIKYHANILISTDDVNTRS